MRTAPSVSLERQSDHEQRPPARKLRIGIATSGRFHLLDVARELDALGFGVDFYSYVPRKRAAKFSLPARCHVALLPILFPLVGMERLLPNHFPGVIERLMSWALDAMVILRMRPCDVFICMSGMYLLAPRFAKWRYGALIVLQRASRHIVSQQEILADLPKARKVTAFMVRRELEGYNLADQIAVPSTQVVESFSSWPEHSHKLFLNPFGVDLEQFPMRSGALPSQPTVLFVGHWSFRKGVDVLQRAIEPMDGVNLVHVGAILDAPFPKHPRFFHYEPVPQWKLKEFYGAAHIFALASREEGLAFVQAQALASGLQLVCTDRTGGSDLAALPGLSRLIRVVPVGDADALRVALYQAIDDASGKTGVMPITDGERQSLSWRNYALRQLTVMRELLHRDNAAGGDRPEKTRWKKRSIIHSSG